MKNVHLYMKLTGRALVLRVGAPPLCVKIGPNQPRHRKRETVKKRSKVTRKSRTELHQLRDVALEQPPERPLVFEQNSSSFSTESIIFSVKNHQFEWKITASSSPRLAPPVSKTSVFSMSNIHHQFLQKWARNKPRNTPRRNPL